MHTIHPKLALACGLLIATPVAAQTYGDSAKPQSKSPTFSATLSGTHEVPQVNTIGTGMAKFTVKNDSIIVFALTLTGVPDVTGAHIHLGGSDAAGEPVATLLKGADPGGKVSGMISPKGFAWDTPASPADRRHEVGGRVCERPHQDPSGR